MLMLAEAAAHLPLAAVALPAWLCGWPREPRLRCQGGLPRPSLLLREALLRQVLLPLLSPTGRRLGLQELDDVDSLAGGLVQCPESACRQRASGDVKWCGVDQRLVSRR